MATQTLGITQMVPESTFITESLAEESAVDEPVSMPYVIVRMALAFLEGLTGVWGTFKHGI